MNSADINTKLVDSYLMLLENMSPVNKLKLISKLTQTVKDDIKPDLRDFYHAFGGWDEHESAQELVDSVKGARKFTRTIESI